MNRLENKRALITGGTSGIGLEIARLFLQEGARVAITGQTEASVAAARKEVGDQLLGFASNAADIGQQKVLAEQMRSSFETLDILVVNAGIADLRPIEAWDEGGYARTFDINVRGPFFLIQALLPIFGKPASIVLNASINAHIGMPNTSVYGASKAALSSLARTMSGEMAARGIRVNAISPGPVDTPLYKKLGLSDSDLEKTAEAIRSQVPIGRFGRVSEIANAALFLASDESGFVVGSDLILDGGMSL